LRPAQAKKLVRFQAKNKPGMVVYACNPRYMGHRGRRITVQS
jgi:hypothetical protein